MDNVLDFVWHEISGQGFEEIKSNHEHNSFVELKMVNCLTSNVKQNYKEKKTFTLKDLGAAWYGRCK